MPQYNQSFVQNIAPYSPTGSHGYSGFHAPAPAQNDTIEDIAKVLLIAGIGKALLGGGNKQHAAGSLNESSQTQTRAVAASDYSNGGNTPAIANAPDLTGGGSSGLSGDDIDELLAGNTEEDTDGEEDAEGSAADDGGVTPGGSLVGHGLMASAVGGRQIARSLGVDPWLGKQTRRATDGVRNLVSKKPNEMKIAADEITEQLSKGAKGHLKGSKDAAAKLLDKAKDFETKFGDIRNSLRSDFRSIRSAASPEKQAKIDKLAPKVKKHLDAVETAVANSRKQAKKAKDAMKLIADNTAELKHGGKRAKEALKIIEDQKEILNKALPKVQKYADDAEGAFIKARRHLKNMGYKKSVLKGYADKITKFTKESGKLAKHSKAITTGLEASDTFLKSIGANYSDDVLKAVASGTDDAAEVAARLAANGTKAGVKVGGTLAGKALGYAIPGVSLGVGGYFAYQKLKDGDILGAISEGAAGILGCFPGLGTAASLALTGANTYVDVTGGNMTKGAVEGIAGIGEGLGKTVDYFNEGRV
jgi:methyl-accepting chemotaxis protein